MVFFERIVVYIVGLFLISERGNCYILVGDYFIKLMEVYFVENIMGEIVVDVMF